MQGFETVQPREENRLAGFDPDGTSGGPEPRRFYQHLCMAVRHCKCQGKRFDDQRQSSLIICPVGEPGFELLFIYRTDEKVSERPGRQDCQMIGVPKRGFYIDIPFDQSLLNQL